MKPMHCCRALARNAQYCSSEPFRIGCYWMYLEDTLLDIDRSFLCYRLSLISNERIQCFTSLFSKRRKRQVQNQQVDFGTAMVAGNHLGRLEVAPFWTFVPFWNHQDSYLWRATYFGIKGLPTATLCDYGTAMNRGNCFGCRSFDFITTGLSSTIAFSWCKRLI